MQLFRVNSKLAISASTVSVTARCGSPGAGSGGPLRDQRGAIATLRRLPELGVNFIDTADSYGPDVSEELIREALHPYPGLVIATKAGLHAKARIAGRPRAIRNI